MEKEITFRFKEGITLKEEADGAFLVDAEAAEVRVVNFVGAILLKICDGELSRETMVNVLREKYPDKSLRTIEGDVDRFIAGLDGFVEPSNIPDSSGKSILAYVCPPPSSVSLAVTNACNLRCKHCAPAAGKLSSDELSTSEWLELISELREMGVSRFSLTGGEVFLRDDILEIMLKVTEFCTSLQVNTNATILTETTGRQLSALPCAPFLVVGLDGASSRTHDFLRGNGAFENALRGLEILKRYNVNFKIFTVVTPFNRHELEEIAQLAKEIGARQIDFAFVITTGRVHCYKSDFSLPREEIVAMLADIERLASTYPRFVAGPCLDVARRFQYFRRNVDVHYPNSGKFSCCGGGIRSCTIWPEGSITPCDLTPDMKVGNIRESNFAHVWQSSEVLRWLRGLNGVELSGIEGCRECNYKMLCIGSCPAAAYAETGKWSCKSSLCVTPEKEEI